MSSGWRCPDPDEDYTQYLTYMLTWPNPYLPPVRVYRWLTGDCDHDENYPYDYEAYLGIHDYVFEPEDD